MAEYDGRTPVHLAASEGHLRVVEFFADQRVPLDLRDRRGNTPLAGAGDHRVLVAYELVANDETRQIDRGALQLEGEVKSQRTVDLRGQERLLAVVADERNDQRRSWIVDLGNASKLGVEDLKGKHVEVGGVPCERDGRHLVLARSIELDGQRYDVDRRMSPSSGLAVGSGLEVTRAR